MAKPWSEPQHKILRDILKKARKDSKMTQSRLGELLGQPQSYVAKFERGERRLDIFEMTEVTTALGRNIVDVVEELIEQGGLATLPQSRR